MLSRADSSQPQEIDLWFDETTEVSTLSLVNRNGKATLFNPGREELTTIEGDGSARSPFRLGQSASLGYMSGNHIGLACFESGSVIIANSQNAIYSLGANDQLKQLLAPKQLPPGQLACLAGDGKGNVYACIRAPKEDAPERIFKVVATGNGAGKAPTHIASLRQHVRAACMAFHPPSSSLVIGTDNHGLVSVGVPAAAGGKSPPPVELVLEEDDASDDDGSDGSGGGASGDGDGSDDYGLGGWGGGHNDSDGGDHEPEWPGLRISGIAVDAQGFLIVADAYEQGRGWGPVGSRSLLGRVSRLQLADAKAGVLRGRETLLKGLEHQLLHHLHVLPCGFLAALAFDKLKQFEPEGACPWFWRLPLAAAPAAAKAGGASAAAPAVAPRAGGSKAADAHGHARELAGMFIGGGGGEVVELQVGSKAAGGPAIFSVHRSLLAGSWGWLASGLAKSTGALKATSEQQKALDATAPYVFGVALAYLYSRTVDFEGVAADHPAAAALTAAPAAGAKAAAASKAGVGKGGKKGAKGAGAIGGAAAVEAGSGGALELAKAVAVAAHRLQLPGLQEAAEGFIAAHVSPDNLAALLTKAAAGQHAAGSAKRRRVGK
ncbi:hypothetical protein HYH02_001817 [Chlamydomonas schloesseri]|uniref:BTB domain-containing protein n=1 Tax=Chlamydomonas schloesseri TaxID=2026947 RepID=A0A835WSW4_9CHLO|nr:hypothetical protein HYH02_001817 [Chlamydomonas schloesseri]|eukprot:KAG2453599.1 hypothetical protein HYH02_001817 [Chlamydomonas schloesseri]